jgi:amidohydrolase
MEAKTAAQSKIEDVQPTLLKLSHLIHANPELKFEEEKAANWLCEALDQAGFKVEKGICDLPTAFRATTGHGPLHLAICAEYDCLAGIGHACGHNLIAAMAVGAALGAASVADEVGLTISVIGTPGEEGGGGKILLLERGAFQGIHAAMMVHPTSTPYDVSQPLIIAACGFDVKYTGKEAHASAYPELGINAADALTIAQTAIGLLRQHILFTDRVHGIITRGGDAPNVIPAHTAASYIVRSKTLDELTTLRARVERCFEAGALASGASLEIMDTAKPYAQMVHDTEIAAIYQHNGEALGRKFKPASSVSGSTDMGNVSLALPSIHPMIGLDVLPAVMHQPEMTAHCRTEKADRTIIEGSKAMAMTAIDLALNPSVRKRLMASGVNK